MPIVWFLSRLFAVLHSAATPAQIAGGAALGMVAGLTPSTPVDFLVLVLLITLNVNLAAGLFSMALFSIVGYLIDPVAHFLGFFLLAQAGPLRPFWSILYNTPFIPFTGFNNTVVMGNLVLGLILAIPLFVQGARAVAIYRERYDERIRNWPPVRYLRTTELYHWYHHLRRLGEQLW